MAMAPPLAQVRTYGVEVSRASSHGQLLAPAQDESVGLYTVAEGDEVVGFNRDREVPVCTN
jgi:hypothetical protein